MLVVRFKHHNFTWNVWANAACCLYYSSVAVVFSYAEAKKSTDISDTKHGTQHFVSVRQVIKVSKWKWSPLERWHTSASKNEWRRRAGNGGGQSALCEIRMVKQNAWLRLRSTQCKQTIRSWMRWKRDGETHVSHACNSFNLTERLLPTANGEYFEFTAADTWKLAYARHRALVVSLSASLFTAGYSLRTKNAIHVHLARIRHK